VESPWRIERDAFARAFGGAFLFGMPLLFTMEMWWIGESLSRPQLVGLLALALLVNIALAYFSGFRRGACTFRNALLQAVEACAVGVVVAIFVLVALNQINGSASFGAILGMLIVQAAPLSVGASVATAVFDPDKGRVGDESANASPLRELLSDVGATAGGALFLGFAIAPTEEVPLLAVGLGLPHAIGLVALTLTAMYVIVFASGFDPDHRDRVDPGLFQEPFSESVLAYVVSLLVAVVLLVCFGQLLSGDPISSVLKEALVLGVPASIGGAAGRIIT